MGKLSLGRSFGLMPANRGIADIQFAPVNADGRVDAVDLASWTTGMQLGTSAGDADGDGDTDGAETAADGVVIVARAQKTRTRDLERSLAELRPVNVLGVVLTDSREAKSA